MLNNSNLAVVLEPENDTYSEYAPIETEETEKTSSVENEELEKVTNSKSLSDKLAIVVSKLKVNNKEMAYTAKKAVSDKIKKLSLNSNVQLKKKIALAIMGAAATASVIMAANGLIEKSSRTNNLNKQYVFEEIQEPIVDTETIITGYKVNKENISKIEDISAGDILKYKLNNETSSAEDINSSKNLESNIVTENLNNNQSDIKSISKEENKEKVGETMGLGSTFIANNLRFYEGPKETGRSGKVLTQEMKIDIIDVMDENGNLVGIYRAASGDEISIDELKDKYGDSVKISCHVSKSKDGQTYQDGGWAYLSTIENSINNENLSISYDQDEGR